MSESKYRNCSAHRILKLDGVLKSIFLILGMRKFRYGEGKGFS